MTGRLATLALLCSAWLSAADPFRFVILGDRAGEPEPGVFERVLKAGAAEKPAFMLTVGDAIQGLNEATAEAEWQSFQSLIAPYRSTPFYLTPGNHDIWSDASKTWYEKYSGRPAHYSFDYRDAHFTVIDNSRTENIAPAEMDFLEADLKAHATQQLKFVIMHRPSWIVNALLRDNSFPLHALAKKYGVQFVIAGHVHEMLHYTVEGIEYLSMASSGGHLRLSNKYEEGWFFGYTVVDVESGKVKMTIHELDGRVTDLTAWGPIGLAGGK